MQHRSRVALGHSHLSVWVQREDFQELLISALMSGASERVAEKVENGCHSSHGAI